MHEKTTIQTGNEVSSQFVHLLVFCFVFVFFPAFLYPAYIRVLRNSPSKKCGNFAEENCSNSQKIFDSICKLFFSPTIEALL